MNRLLLSALLVPVFFSCQSENADKNTDESPEKHPVGIAIDAPEEPLATDPGTEAKLPEQNWLLYEGTIGLQEAHVVAFLTYTDQNDVRGSYFYSNHQKPLAISGTYDTRTGTYSLTESYKGKTTGVMTLKNSNGNLEGSWKKSSKSSESQPMHLHFLERKKVAEPHTSFEKYENTHDIAIFYNGNDDEFETVTDELKISIFSDKFRSFDYNLIGPNAHTGAAAGLIEMENDSTGYFHGEDDCTLTFHFRRKSVAISEDNCMYYHGARAYMDNELEKVK